MVSFCKTTGLVELLDASATRTLFAGLSSVLRKIAAAPFVSNVKVYVPALATRTKPINQTVSAEDELPTYRASSVQSKAALDGIGGFATDNEA